MEVGEDKPDTSVYLLPGHRRKPAADPAELIERLHKWAAAEADVDVVEDGDNLMREAAWCIKTLQEKYLKENEWRETVEGQLSALLSDVVEGHKHVKPSSD